MKRDWAWAMAWAVAIGAAHAENWPQWRGPFFNGSTTEKGLPATWSQTENVAWATPMPGPSAATPIVWGDRVFVSSVDAKSKDLVAICLSAKDGDILWMQRTGKNRPARNNNTMASPSPCTDGKAVYFFYGTGDLAAFDLEGNRLWARELEKDHGEFVLQYGYGSSPLLHKGILYVLVLQNPSPAKYKPSDRKGPLDSYLLAVDAKTGKDLWKHVRPTDGTDESTEAYVTPMPYEGSGRSEILISGGEYVTGHDAATGAELWRWAFSPPDRKIWQRLVSSPVPGDGLVYAVRCQHRPLFALKGGGNGRLTDDAIAWKLDEKTPDASTPLLYNDRLYVVYDGMVYPKQEPANAIACLDAKTGERKWEGKLDATSIMPASAVGADGKVYCISEAGEAFVLAAGDEFRVLARIRMGEPPCRSSLAIANGRLFLRTAKKLYCIAAGGK